MRWFVVAVVMAIGLSMADDAVGIVLPVGTVIGCCVDFHSSVSFGGIRAEIKKVEVYRCDFYGHTSDESPLPAGVYSLALQGGNKNGGAYRRAEIKMVTVGEYRAVFYCVTPMGLSTIWTRVDRRIVYSWVTTGVLPEYFDGGRAAPPNKLLVTIIKNKNLSATWGTVKNN